MCRYNQRTNKLDEQQTRNYYMTVTSPTKQLYGVENVSVSFITPALYLFKITALDFIINVPNIILVSLENVISVYFL